MQLIHDLGKSLALLDPATSRMFWKYVYTGKPKPYFHPVCTPAGHRLTNFEPHDHLWQRGLWFAIKFVNGVNFWEEENAFGIQKTLGMPMVRHEDNDRIAVTSRVSWVTPAEVSLIEERRDFVWIPMGEDAWAFDFDFRLIPQMDLKLDRTPFTTWGGYGGLTLRGTRNWQKTRILLSDGTITDRPTGNSGQWADISGKLDGGSNQSGGYAFLDHPANGRHPTPWYGGTADSNYINAAFLFHEPMSLARDQVLRLRYRVIIHDGVWESQRLNRAWEEYAGK